MKLLTLNSFVLLSSFLTTVDAQQPVPFTDKRWTFNAQGQVVEFYKGHQALYLMNGIAWLKDEKFLNGVIEFDMFLFDRVSFSGTIFRISDQFNFEELYFRSHQNHNPDAFQYTPVFNGNSAWQLYHDQYDAVNDGYVHWKPRGKDMGYNGVLDYPFDRWMHVKLLVKGDQAELYLDHSAQPSAFIRDLKRDHKPGGIGVRSVQGATYFSNFTFVNQDDIELKTKDVFSPSAEKGAIMTWNISTPIAEQVVSKEVQLEPKLLNVLKWSKLDAEKNGLINLSTTARVTDSTNTILARLVIESEREQVKRIDLAFSDRVRVFVNGRIVFHGNDNFRTRDYRYLGTIGFFDAVYIPLKKGENLVHIAVSETFGGWGLMAKIEDVEGIRIVQ